jgi:hypothetical protein
LAAEKTYTNLDISVLEALEYRGSRFDGVASCTINETLGAIMERIVKKEVFNYSKLFFMQHFFSKFAVFLRVGSPSCYC